MAKEIEELGGGVEDTAPVNTHKVPLQKADRTTVFTSLGNILKFVLSTNGGIIGRVGNAIVELIGGWIGAEGTWEFFSWDDTNGVSTAVFTVPSDATTIYQVGNKIKFEQSTGGVKYGIVTKVETTKVTAFINPDYTFINEAITNPCYSRDASPFGFDLDETKRSVILSDTTNRSEGTPTQNQWYNIGTLSTDKPIGLGWDLFYLVSIQFIDAVAAAWDMEVTLSTTNNSESDPDATLRIYGQDLKSMQVAVSQRFPTTVEAKTTYYLNGRTTASGMGSGLRFRGDVVTTKIKAIWVRV